MNVEIKSSALRGSICAPPSKSYMHRALICATAADSETLIKCTAFSKDIEATMGCLAALGAKIDITEKGVYVTPINNQENNGECILDCGESGSTLRMLLPFAASLGKRAVFKGCERLGKRPLLPLCNALNEGGVQTMFSKSSFLPCEISGKMKDGAYTITGGVSSQFITGLLLAGAVMGNIEINIEGELKSAQYVDITADVLKKFGTTAIKTENGYKIENSTALCSPKEMTIEGDYSNAAFWLVAGAIGGEISITGLNQSSVQGDMKIIEVLKKMGADINVSGDSIEVCKSKLRGVEIDADNIPDLVPILSVAASAASGVTVIKNIERLREKESDRVTSTINMINALGGEAQSDDNTITIVGKGRLLGGTVDSVNDHRIAMSGAIASLIAKQSVIIMGAEAVEKSYPDFFDKFKMLGGEVI